MALFVADASVAVAWLHSHQATPATDALLEKVGTELTAIVPPLWRYEVTNAILSLLSRGRLTLDECSTYLNDLRRLRYQVDPVVAESGLITLIRLACDHRLSIYDAAYLEVALRRNIPLATKDNPLRKAASKCGVELCF